MTPSGPDRGAPATEPSAAQPAQFLYTERAHLMCPHMCFGIALSIDRPYDAALLQSAVDRLADAHPFLKALLGRDAASGAYTYRVTERSQAELLLMRAELPGADSPEVLEAFRRLTGRDWDLLREGMLKIAAWRMGEQTCLLLVFHHLLADGRGALGLAEELADCYALGRTPAFAPERLIASLEDMPAKARMPLVSRLLIRSANRRWARERQRVSYEAYHSFADQFLRADAVRCTLTRVSAEELGAMRQACHAHGVSVNDVLVARRMAEDGVRRLIIACDLRSRLAVYRAGALGNYSTAFSVEVRQKEKDLYALAQAVHRQVQRTMNRPAALWLVLQCYARLDPGLLDAAFLSCRGGFPSEAGKFIGSLFFGFGAASGHSITNLGSITSESIASAYFLPPASPAIRKIQGVLTVNGVMTICTCERPG